MQCPPKRTSILRVILKTSSSVCLLFELVDSFFAWSLPSFCWCISEWSFFLLHNLVSILPISAGPQLICSRHHLLAIHCVSHIATTSFGPHFFLRINLFEERPPHRFPASRPCVLRRRTDPQLCWRVLRDALILPRRCPHLFFGSRRPFTSILLFGPPGNPFQVPMISSHDTRLLNTGSA